MAIISHQKRPRYEYGINSKTEFLVLHNFIKIFFSYFFFSNFGPQTFCRIITPFGTYGK